MLGIMLRTFIYEICIERILSGFFMNFSMDDSSRIVVLLKYEFDDTFDITYGHLLVDEGEDYVIVSGIGSDMWYGHGTGGYHAYSSECRFPITFERRVFDSFCIWFECSVSEFEVAVRHHASLMLSSGVSER